MDCEVIIELSFITLLQLGGHIFVRDLNTVIKYSTCLAIRLPVVYSRFFFSMF